MACSMALSVVVFDLDNTLYRRDSGLMQEVGRRIQQWLCDHVGLTWQQSVVVRREYLDRYGTTLGGLIAEHDVNAGDYLTFVHNIQIAEYLAPDPALGEMLAAIPLRKVVYTNATSEYGWRVLQALEVDELFEQVIGIDDVSLCNKPCREAYERVLELLGADGRQCAMIEDTARNLKPARALGMTTVLVGDEPDEHVDFTVGSVLEVGQVVADLLAQRGGRPATWGGYGELHLAPADS